MEEAKIRDKIKEYMHNSDVRVRLPKLKAVTKRNIKEQVREVEAVMVRVKATNVTETNALMYAGARIVTERLNLKPRRKTECKAEKRAYQA